jgi:hypothetical protein
MLEIWENQQVLLLKVASVPSLSFSRFFNLVKLLRMEEGLLASSFGKWYSGIVLDVRNYSGG